VPEPATAAVLPIGRWYRFIGKTGFNCDYDGTNWTFNGVDGTFTTPCINAIAERIAMYCNKRNYTKGYKVDGWQVMRFHETRLTAAEHRTMAGL
jgi:hypothetical protein